MHSLQNGFEKIGLNLACQSFSKVRTYKIHIFWQFTYIVCLRRDVFQIPISIHCSHNVSFTIVCNGKYNEQFYLISDLSIFNIIWTTPTLYNDIIFQAFINIYKRTIYMQDSQKPHMNNYLLQAKNNNLYCNKFVLKSALALEF